MGDDRHLSVGLLRAIDRGEGHSGDLAAVALAHLFEVCPACRVAFESWRREKGEGTAGSLLTEYDGPFERCRAAVAGKMVEVESEQAAARERARELLALRPDERVDRVREEPARFAGPTLAALLLDEARGHLPGRPRDAHAVAALAQAILQHASPTPYVSELYARSLTHQANALRAQGELRLADQLFQAARFLLKTQGGGDGLVSAELDHMEGVLRRDQRRFQEAEALLERAVASYRAEERLADEAQGLISLGVAYRQSRELSRALEVVERAERLLSRLKDERLTLLVRHNRALYTWEAGEPEKAREIFTASRELYDRFPDPAIQLRRLWLEAHLTKAEGDFEAAESRYRAAQEGFLREGIGYDAALVALDLAMLFAEQGRTGELKRLAEEIVPVFEAQDVHREAAAALLLFQDAVRTEQVTLRYLIELSRYLERARLDPTLPFRRPA
jgi:tetratricopeptide (TPR) repeat protein